MLCASCVVPSSTGTYFVLQSLHKACPSTTLYYKACTKYVPVLLGTTQLAQSTSQYYFALQSLHKKLPSITLYYKACTKACSSTTLYYTACAKYVPVLLCTTELAQSTSQYYFVLQSLQKVRPRTSLYCKACTKYLPILLCTTKLAQSTSQYYFVLQRLRKALPSTTLYSKLAQSTSPVLLCTTKLTQNSSHLVTYHYRSLDAHHDLPSPAAKENSIRHAAMKPSNLDAAITMRSAETELQNTVELRAKASKIAAPKPDLDAKAEIC